MEDVNDNPPKFSEPTFNIGISEKDEADKILFQLNVSKLIMINPLTARFRVKIKIFKPEKLIFLSFSIFKNFSERDFLIASLRALPNKGII